MNPFNFENVYLITVDMLFSVHEQYNFFLMFPVSRGFCKGPSQVSSYSHTQFGTYSKVQLTVSDLKCVLGAQLCP